MRRRLPEGVRMYTGDDFAYAELIAGDEHGHSDALLGIFDPIAPAVGGALACLSRSDLGGFHDILAPTVPLSRHIFRAPTRFYKTGVVFMAWLNGHQDHFTMVGGQQSARHVLHLAELFRLLRVDRPALAPPPDGHHLFVAELVAANSGLGYAISYAFNNFENGTMYALMLFVIVLVTIVNALFYGYERHLLRRWGR